MLYMRVVIQALGDEGIRGDLIVLGGGAPLNAAFAESIGPDYCRDAAGAVVTAKRLMGERRQQVVA
ncbi:MAG: hypothetical protein ACE5HA_07350 [Anaerolineae bacterium]